MWFLLTWVFITLTQNYRIINVKPKNKKQVKNIIFWVISFSSFLAKNKEITGDVLNKAHPIPMGRVLNTICCSNIPILVPNNIESKNLFCWFFSIFFRKKLILNLFKVIKKNIAPNNLISVVSKGDKLLWRKTILEKRPPKTAHKTDKKGNA